MILWRPGRLVYAVVRATGTRLSVTGRAPVLSPEQPECSIRGDALPQQCGMRTESPAVPSPAGGTAVSMSQLA